MRLRNILLNAHFSTATCAVGLSLLAATGQAQDTQQQVQKEYIMTATTTARPKNEMNIDKDAIRPFKVNIPEEALVDLRRRILATRLPDQELVK